jgi:hypothetical protein
LKDDKKQAMYDQVGHEAYEQATAGGAYEGSPHAGSPFTGGGVRGGGGFGGFSETMFGDAFGGGMEEVVTVELTLREAVGRLYKTSVLFHANAMSCLQWEWLSSCSQTTDMYYLWWNQQGGDAESIFEAGVRVPNMQRPGKDSPGTLSSMSGFWNSWS